MTPSLKVIGINTATLTWGIMNLNYFTQVLTEPSEFTLATQFLSQENLIKNF